MATKRLSEMTDTRLDMSTNAAQILAINGAFAGFAVVVVLLRVYVRAVMLKTMGIDDYLMMGATVRIPSQLASVLSKGKDLLLDWGHKPPLRLFLPTFPPF